MADRTWIFVPAVACCATVSVLIPDARHFYVQFWASFQSEQSLANQVAIVASLTSVVLAPMLGAVGLTLHWRFRTIDALKTDRDAADELRRAAEDETKSERAKVKKLASEIASLDYRAPDRFLMSAMLCESGPSTKASVIQILETGLETVREPLADGCRLLARKLLQRDAPGDFPSAERAAKIAATLAPLDGQDRELAHVIVERNAAIALADNAYSPLDPRFEPVLVGDELEPHNAGTLVNRLRERADQAVWGGDYFLAVRLATKAKIIAENYQPILVQCRARYTYALAVSFLGFWAVAVDEIDAFTDQQANVLGQEHPDVIKTHLLRAQILDNLGRYDESLSAIDTFVNQQARVLGQEHPDVFATCYLRAKVLDRLDRHSEALAVIDRFAERQARILGDEHPNVFATRHVRAQVLDSLGRYDDALATIDDFAGQHAHVLGQEHPDVFATCYLRAQVLYNLGRHDDALAAIDSFADQQTRVLGEIHPVVFATRYLRALVLYNLGRSVDALTLIDAFADQHARALGDAHPDVLATRVLRALVLENIGRHDDGRRNE